MVPEHTQHVRRVVAGEECAIGKPLVEHAIEAVGLVHIAVDGVFDLFLGVDVEGRVHVQDAEVVVADEPGGREVADRNGVVVVDPRSAARVPVKPCILL